MADELENGRSGADAPSGCQPSASAAVPASSQSGIPNALTLSYGGIRDIYYAGTQRGTEEATAFDWGSSPTGKWHDNLTGALHDILNEGQRYGEPGYHDWDAVEAWVTAQEAAWAADLASWIEARRAATPKSGAVVDESQVGATSAETPNP